MPYVDPEIIAEVKRVDLLTYLQERDPDTGRVSIDKVSEFIAQLLEQVAPNS